jgi:hypothetical protein
VPFAANALVVRLSVPIHVVVDEKSVEVALAKVFKSENVFAVVVPKAVEIAGVVPPLEIIGYVPVTAVRVPLPLLLNVVQSAGLRHPNVEPDAVLHVRAVPELRTALEPPETVMPVPVRLPRVVVDRRVVPLPRRTVPLWKAAHPVPPCGTVETASAEANWMRLNMVMKSAATRSVNLRINNCER